MSKLAQLSIAAALVVAGHGVVRADDATFEKTRADVIAELDSARASGELDAMHGEDSGSAYLSRQSAGGGATRSAVKAQVMAARRNGEIDVTGEDSGSFALNRATAPSGVTRAEVVAELRRARDSGELSALNGEDSGSEFLKRSMPAHWTRYAGPDTGRGNPQPATVDQG